MTQAAHTNYSRGRVDYDTAPAQEALIPTLFYARREYVAQVNRTTEVLYHAALHNYSHRRDVDLVRTPAPGSCGENYDAGENDKPEEQFVETVDEGVMSRPVLHRQ